MRPPALALAALLVAAPASAQFEGVMDSRMTVEGEAHGMTGTGRMYLSRSGVRMEMQMSATAGDGPTGMKVTTLVLRSKPGVLYMLNDERKTYSEIDTTKMGDPARDAPRQQYTVKKVGAEKVAGYDCVHAVVTDEKGEQFDVWSTKEIAGAAEYWRMQNKRGENRTAMFDALKEAGADGWPLKWHQRTGKDRVTWETTKIEKRSPSASLFELTGYTKVEGGMMGGASQMQLSPEQQKRMQEGMKQRDEALKGLPPEQRKKIEEMMKSMGR